MTQKIGGVQSPMTLSTGKTREFPGTVSGCAFRDGSEISINLLAAVSETILNTKLVNEGRDRGATAGYIEIDLQNNIHLEAGTRFEITNVSERSGNTATVELEATGYLQDEGRVGIHLDEDFFGEHGQAGDIFEIKMVDASGAESLATTFALEAQPARPPGGLVPKLDTIEGSTQIDKKILGTVDTRPPRLDAEKLRFITDGNEVILTGDDAAEPLASLEIAFSTFSGWAKKEGRVDENGNVSLSFKGIDDGARVCIKVGDGANQSITYMLYSADPDKPAKPLARPLADALIDAVFARNKK